MSFSGLNVKSNLGLGFDSSARVSEDLAHGLETAHVLVGVQAPLLKAVPEALREALDQVIELHLVADLGARLAVLAVFDAGPGVERRDAHCRLHAGLAAVVVHHREVVLVEGLVAAPAGGLGQESQDN